MQLKISPTNIEQRLLKYRNRTIDENDIMNQVHDILQTHSSSEKSIQLELKEGNFAESNAFIFDFLKTDKIFHINDIEKICVDYRLRFLNANLLKSEVPLEAVKKIKALEKQHHTSLKGFKIMAPSKLFKLENADDPLLFAPIGNGYYYLIHKWGNDLHPFRKVLMWPFKTLENFVVLLLAGSFLCALLVPDGLFSQDQSITQFLMIFFFIFKWLAGLSIFYGFKMGKNFSSEIWNSKYYNA
ncbi:hypothetical protein [Christiangramia aquimixticola]|uniref:hypothetical protein n=1 Tax=Christiangramia aquimixticola TaxID=1697558 RepID=UPI003AA92E6B